MLAGPAPLAAALVTLGGLEIGLLEGAELAGAVVGMAMGLVLQRLSDPGTTCDLRSIVRSLPWWALLAVPLLATLRWAGSTAACPVRNTAGSIALLYTGGVALLQIAAAAAGRGKPAPLVRAAPWVRAISFAGLLAYLLPTSDAPPEASATLAAAALAVAIAAAALRRPPGLGAAFVIAAALDGVVVARNLEAVLPPYVPYVIVNTALLLARLMLAAVFIRRLGRRPLGALGIDVGAPGDLYAAFHVAWWCAWVLESQILMPFRTPGNTWFDGVPGLFWYVHNLGCNLGSTLVVGALLVLLRRRVDDAAASRRPPPPAPPPSPS